MDGLRVATTNAAVVLLETRFGKTSTGVIRRKVRAYYAAHGPQAAVRAIDCMRRYPNRLRTLCLVWRALHAWQAGALGESTEAAHENMRRALGTNLADCVGAGGKLVCETGTRGQLIKTLGGYFLEVEGVPLTPQELVNEVAAGLQQELRGALPSRVQLQVFQQRCYAQAVSLYGAHSQHVQALSAHVGVACAALSA